MAGLLLARGQGCLVLSPSLLPVSIFSSIWTQTVFKDSIAHAVYLATVLILLQLRCCPVERGSCHLRCLASKPLHQLGGAMTINRHIWSPPQWLCWGRDVPSAGVEGGLRHCSLSAPAHQQAPVLPPIKLQAQMPFRLIRGH